MSVHDRVRFTEEAPNTMEVFMEIADKDFYAPTGKPDFIELPLPDGVHILSRESERILARARLRGAQIAQRHITSEVVYNGYLMKRGS
jgi:hypothetical protein